MWIAVGSVAGLIVGLIVGFWFGHYFGFEQCKDEIQADAGAYDLINKNDGLVQDIQWAYHNLLFRQPTEREVVGWASMPRPFEEICKLFARSVEYQRLPPDMKLKARTAASMRGVSLPA